MFKREKIINRILFVLLCFISFVYFIPLLMMILGSFKSQAQAVLFDLSWPKKFLWSNYKHVIVYGKIFQGYFNSIIITSISTIVVTILGAFTGIVISRRTDGVVTSLYYYFIFGLTVTLQLASTFGILKFLNIYGNLFGVICIFVAQRMAFTVMTFSSFVKGIPKELDEAAIIDGCGPIRLVFSVLLPVMKPILITNIIITAVGVWNNFMVPLFFISKSSKWPVPLTVYSFFGMYARDWQYVFTTLILTVVPILILFLCLQKYIVGGMTSGSVKG